MDRRERTIFKLSYPPNEKKAFNNAVPILYPLLDVPLNEVLMSKFPVLGIRKCPPSAAKPVHTIKAKMNSFTALRRSCNHRPTRGVTVWMPTAKAVAAIAKPRRFQVVVSVPAAWRR